jgi:DNA polymerase
MPAASLDDLALEAQGCTRCRLAHGRTTVVFGMGDPEADLMFIGEGPGEQEDLQGLPFVGRSGQLLDRLMAEEMGMSREPGGGVYIANVVKCRPPGNRDPQPDEIDTCRPYLEGQLELIDPRVVVALGNFSAKLLLGTTVGITKLRGTVYPFGNRWLVPTYHPAAILRGGGDKLAEMRADLVRAKQALLAPPPAPEGTPPSVSGPGQRSAHPDAGAETASLFEP